MRNFYSLRTVFTAFLAVLSFSLLTAATIPVTSGADSGAGSLRAAVMSAASGDTITFAGVSTVTLSSQIDIAKDINIFGNGIGSTTISGDGATRIFDITGSPTVRFSSFTLTNGATEMSGGAIQNTGTLSVNSIEFTGNTAAGAAANMGGGAIHNAGTLFVGNCTFSENSATGASGSGGAIIVTGGTYTIIRSSFSNNTSNRAGGAIEDVASSADVASITGSSFTGNNAGDNPGNGGAIHITGTSSLFTNGTDYSQNFAGREGGALWNGAGTMTVSGCTITGNEAAGPAADDGGGGLFNNGGTLRLAGNNVVTGNTATGAAGSGGGIFNAVGGTLEVRNATISDNTANRAGGGIEDASRTMGSTTGSVTLTAVTLNTNEVFTSPGNGGGLHVTGPGVARITRSTVQGNVAGAEGGGLWNGTGPMVVSSTLISENTANGDAADQGGGGLFNAGGNLQVIGGSVTGNSANGTSGSGGGILNDAGGNLSVIGTELSNNFANRAGGAIEDNSQSSAFVLLRDVTVDNNTVGTAPGNGGGVHITGPGNMTVDRGSYTNNVAGSEGGGLWNGAGVMNIRGATISGNAANGDDATNGGGGLFNNGGTLNVGSGVTISENTALGAAGSGGGIHNATGGRLIVTDAVISDNASSRAGGGIEDASGAASAFRVTGATISGNDAGSSPGNGGGIHIGGDGNTLVRNTNFDGNTAVEGGGLWNGSGVLRVQGSTIANNEATGDDLTQGGGGLFNNGGGTIVVERESFVTGNLATGTAGSGGGISNQDGGNLYVNNSTISANVAERAGGGIEDNSGAGSVFRVTDSDFLTNVVNTSPGNGGGIHITGTGGLSYNRGFVTGNTAGSEGGGVWNSTGRMNINGVTFTSNVASGDDATNGGGGLFNNGGTLVVRNSVIDMNVADGASGSGGGLMTTDGTVIVTNTTFSSNTSSRAGGGVEQIDGSFQSVDNDYTGNITGTAPGNGGAFHVTSPNSATSSFLRGTISGNSAANEGGGLWNNTNSIMTVRDVAITGNTVTGAGSADGGGGIFVNGGTVNVSRSTISANTVPTAANGGGAGITNTASGTLNVTSSTISGNTTAGSAGGIGNAGTLNVTSSTIAFNTAALGAGGLAQVSGTTTLTNTIISDNTAAVGTDYTNTGGTLSSGGFNLIGTDNPGGVGGSFSATGSDILNGNANLAALANNGGLTETHALQCPSDAVDAGSGGIDQTGNGASGQRDIGAFELQGGCNFAPGDTEIASSFATEEVNIYPNPTGASMVNVNLPADIQGKVTLRILDGSGRVRSERVASGGVTRLDVSQLPTGAYSVQVINGDEMSAHRLMIVR